MRSRISFGASVSEKIENPPPLTREASVLQKWRTAGRALFPFLYGEEFHEHPDLAPLVRRVNDKGFLEPLALQTDKKGQPARWEQKQIIQKAISDAWKSFPKS